jgi:hypothetical protein
VPYGADQTVYRVVDRFAGLGSVCRETEIERMDIETIIADFLTGQFNDPIRVIAFNTLEHWSDDVSDEIATEIQTRCDIEGTPVPDHLSDFVASYTRPTRPEAFIGRPALQKPLMLSKLGENAKKVAPLPPPQISVAAAPRFK